MNSRFKCRVEIFSQEKKGTRKVSPSSPYHVPIDLGSDHYFDARIFFDEEVNFDQWINAEIIFLDQQKALTLLKEGIEYGVWESGFAGRMVINEGALSGV